jgi:hypothetical protein
MIKRLGNVETVERESKIEMLYVNLSGLVPLG